VERAHAALAIEDPAMGHLRPQDTTRIARALEVVRSTGRSISDWQKQLVGGIGGQVRVAGAILLPPRDWLRARCDARFEAMLEQGAIEEVEALRARRLDPDLPAMRAIGVPEIIAWQDGLIDRETMVTQAQAATRQYAKRQYTWFRNQPPADWERCEAQPDDNLIGNIAIKLRQKALTA
jgi:tRNA dimethylallyltransferase